MRKRVVILSENIPGGWDPADSDLFGGQELVVNLANEFSYEFETLVFYPAKAGKEAGKVGNVRYLSRDKFDYHEDDILIVDNDHDFRPVKRAFKMYYHSRSVDVPFDLSFYDFYIHISDFHKSRNFWIPEKKAKVIPLGIDMISLMDKRKTGKDIDTILSCSSPDRGLITLLRDWAEIRSHHPSLELKITYGFDNLIKFCGSSSDSFISHFKNLLAQDGIRFLGKVGKDEMEKLYWESKYWVHPLNTPDAELFCLNAIKARATYTTCIVNLTGALKETVGNYIPYSDFVKGKTDIVKHESSFGPASWSEIYARYWSSLLYQ